jgi:hypothetical protein
MADFSIAPSISSLSFIGAGLSAYQRSLKGGAGLLGWLLLETAIVRHRFTLSSTK